MATQWAGAAPSSAQRTTAVLSPLTVSLYHVPAVYATLEGELTDTSAAWTDTKIILNTPDPNYKQTNYKGAGVTGDMKTTDGGKTWTVSTIQIPQFTFGQ